jgi:hypothetical protein
MAYRAYVDSERLVRLGCPVCGGKQYVSVDVPLKFKCDNCQTEQFMPTPRSGWVVDVPDGQLTRLMAAVLRGDVDDVQKVDA